MSMEAATQPSATEGPNRGRRFEPGLVTISVPVYNEEGNITRLLERLRALAEREAHRYRFEFLFTDNASTDRTFEMLAEEAKADPRVRVLRFSRNFGFQKSILTNFVNARGEAAVQIDADLQDPPELISDFLDLWEQGYKVVYGIRRRRPEGWLLRSSRKFYYRLVTKISDVYVPPDAGDFRLIDTVIIEQLAQLNEQAPYLRGYIANLGFPQQGVVYDRDARTAGRTKFKVTDLIELGIDGITSQSTRPLRLITLFGFFVSILTLVGIVIYGLMFALVSEDLPPGWATLTLLMLISIGLNSLFLGLLGEYIGRVFNNVRGMPISIIERRIDGAGAGADGDGGMAAREKAPESFGEQP